MKKESDPNSRPSNDLPQNLQSSPRSAVISIGVAVAAMVLVAGLVYRKHPGSEKDHVKLPTPIQTKTAQLTAHTKNGGVSSAPAEKTNMVLPNSQAPSKVAIDSQTEKLARQLLTFLSQLDVRNGSIPPEKAIEWRQTFDSLRQLGSGALPAIREFLAKNQDLDFEPLSGGEPLGYPSLRVALLSLAHDLGGSDALDLSLRTLESTAEPREIQLLTDFLEQQAPAVHRELEINAARRSLALAREGRMGDKDVGPNFEVLRRFGGAQVVEDLQQASAQWKHYAALALADLPDDAGISALNRMAQRGSENSTVSPLVPMQMLAQASFKSPLARDAFLEQVRLNQVPDAAWTEIAPILGGRFFYIGSKVPDNVLPAPGQPGVRVYHLTFGNQNFYSWQNTTGWSAEQVKQQMVYIDQLLTLTSSPAAVDALQTCRASLLKLPGAN